MTTADRAAELMHAGLASLELAAAEGSGVAASILGFARAQLGGAGRGIDDSAALARVAELTQAGRGREAIGIVAAGDAALARRLRRKRKKSGHL